MGTVAQVLQFLLKLIGQSLIDEAQLSDCVTLFSAFNVLYTDLLPQSILQFTAVFRKGLTVTVR